MAIDVRWLTGFIDRPAAGFERAVAFWCAVTGATLSAARGDDGQFATLLPGDGDAYLRVQRVVSGGGTHVDLHVDDVLAAVAAAQELGASVEHEEPGVTVLRSPAGMTFCIAAAHGSAARPAAPLLDGIVSQLDRVCIDVPAERYNAECAFWVALTGWELRRARVDGFAYLVHPPGMALELLFQRLGDDSPAAVAGAHVDLACLDVDSMVGVHVGLGASVVAEHEFWTVLADPAGFEYCLIRRPPIG